MFRVNEPELQGARLRLRTWHRNDVVAQEQWPDYADPFHALWNLPRAMSFDDQFGIASQRRIWAVEDLQHRLIGRVSIREIEQRARRSRLGITMGAPYVGQGLGTEALNLFLNYYFGALNFVTMALDVAAFNRRAVHCYERLGFRYIESDWRYAGLESHLYLLNSPAYHDLKPFFRRSRHGTFVEFFEMELQRNQWNNTRGS